MNAHHAVILGAGAAGTAAARALAGQQDVRLTLLAQSNEQPTSRMLIKGVAMGMTTPELIRLPLPRAEFVADTARRVDTARREVRLASGAVIGYDSLIVASGSRARRLDAELPGVEEAERAGRLLTLHTLDDAMGVRRALLARGKRARIAIVGGGLIAAETASTLQAQGHLVSLIARSELPGVASFGRSVAARIAADHRSHVSTYFGRSVSRISSEGAASVISLDDGGAIAADLIIMALGTEPLSPAPWENGIDVDDRLRAHGVEGVYAAGGVSVHHDDHLGTWRIDHWEDSMAQATHAAQALLHGLALGQDPGSYRPRSAHMAMMYGRMISGVGIGGFPETEADAGAEARDAEEFLVLHQHQGTVVGASGVDAVGEVYQWGQRLHTVEA
ncbi:FAD-dependent oxidoreductase [Galactobacter caseinivorans]|uniref:Ferredoxin reductase n=1 Tax=Galactobacter caseinivorans TaxID=2676123 RepID=A0A496PKF0_9MICC|nr:NAD(P)/FAD-dependent oxidoreductase [Galactobacter caseinivorans]RKW70961.1 ferredoxin reductase [Galactobacter caseinivorans]